VIAPMMSVTRFTESKISCIVRVASFASRLLMSTFSADSPIRDIAFLRGTA
jgi:hypothetical protein